MRVTVPNPLGPPISIDTASLNGIRVRLASAFSPISPTDPTSTLPLMGMSSSSSSNPHAPSSSSHSSIYNSLVYAYLPTPVANKLRHPAYRRSTFRLSLLLIVLALFTLWRPAPPFPPSYSDEWRTERMVIPSEKGRFVRFDVPKGTGFNHQLQRVVLQHHLAVLGDRGLVYEPYVEDDTTWLPFDISRWPWRSARIPLSAFVASVINGFETFYDAPRAISAYHYSRICPGAKERTYTLRTPENPEGDLELVEDGQARIHQLQVLLAGSDDACIRIRGEVFDDPFFDSKAPLDMIDTLIHSPALDHFIFSPTVLAILNRMLPHIQPESQPYDLEKIAIAASKTPMRTSMWKNILTLHIRRGEDWEAVCDEKGERAAPFVGWNKLPLHPGNEMIPPPADMVEATRLGLYRAKCLPSTLEIIARARRMRKNHPLLRYVYVMTDANDDFANEIRKWLSSEGWEKVFVGKQDLYSDWQDREVGVAVDMEVARRSGVFVGNGFSTTASNIALLRARDGIHPDLTQFW